MQLFQGCLARVSGRGASHELRPWSFLPAEGGRRGLRERGVRWGAAAGCCSRRFCSITVALGVGPGRGSVRSQTSVPRRPLPSDALAPFAASPRLPRCCAARPTPPPRRAKSLEISTAAGTASPPRASPPGLPGPPLPTPPREEKNSLSSVNSAARRSLPRRPGLRRHTPGDWWKSRSPLLPPPAKLPPLTRSDPRRSAGERTPLSRAGPSGGRGKQ